MIRFLVFLFAIWFNVLPRHSAAQEFFDTLPSPQPVAGRCLDLDCTPQLKPLRQPDLSAWTALPQLEYGVPRYHVRTRQIIAPAVFMGVGTLGMATAKVIKWDKTIQVGFRHFHQRHFDDYLQYSNLVTPYLFKLCGVRGRHSYGEYTILLATSYLSMGIIVNTLKHTVQRERPDGSSRTSFPSGHTATAFMGAELLRSEFWEVSPWIGVTGYSLAATIGFMRVYNNRHWTTDVLAGAGIGILSVRIAYWTFPAMQRLFFGKKGTANAYASAAPYYDGRLYGTSLSLSF